MTMKTARVLSSVLLLLLSSSVFAGIGDLTVSPTRVVFEGRQRTAHVTLINRGNEPATYRIGFIQLQMKENGQLVEIQKPNAKEKFADKLIRYSPRQVTLEPGVGQTVRLLLRKPQDLPPGEYRSHLTFFALPSNDVGMNVETLRTTSKKGVNISIHPIFRITIPVIVRNGDLSAHFKIVDLQLHRGDTPSVFLRINRQGNRSVYGDLDIDYLSPTGSKLLISHVKDFVLYTSNDNRTANLPITLPKDVALKGGRIQATYYTTHDGQRTLLAKRELILQ